MNIINNKYNNLKNYSSLFFKAKPYPYVILDNFLDETFFSNLHNNDLNINSKKTFLILILKKINRQVKI